MSGRYIYWIEELRKEQKDLAGNKCANLGEMAGLGLPVPAGFAFSVEAYTTFLNESGADDEIKKYLKEQGSSINDTIKQGEISKHLRRIVQSAAVPNEIEKAIADYYEELRRKCNSQEIAVSVRSSGPVSHPGQYETLLNISGISDLIESVKKVWASTFNPRSLAFRIQKGLPLESDPIGIAVLKMVDAKAAGIIFTADPNTGDTTRMIIEANWGLGESVVSGQSTPDIFTLDKNTLELIEKKLGPKSRYTASGKAGITEVEASPGKSSVFCISDKEAREIAELGKTLEEHYGAPQDIEWAVTQDAVPGNNIVLLQTRNEVIAQEKSSSDQIIDLMLDRFSGR
ncbi:PEP/pyruvate-binding domain-containing protein [Chloroflexota bacterium]